MSRKLFFFALLFILLLTMTGLASAGPAGRAPAARQSDDAAFARIAIPGGVLNSSQLQLADTAAAVDSSLVPWTLVAPMPVGVVDVGAGAFVPSPHRVYIPGGTEADGSLHGTMQVYDIISNTWVDETEVMPLSPQGQGAVCVNPETERIHFVNGVDTQFLYAAHQVYDPNAPAGSRWSTLPFPMLSTGEIFYSQWSGCGWLGGRMFLFGGYGVVDPDPNAKIIANTWMFDPATNQWTDTGQLMNNGRFWHGYANNSSAIWTVGGTDNIATFLPTDTTEAFVPSMGWVPRASMPAGMGRLAPGLSLVGTGAGTTLVQYGGAYFDFGQGAYILDPETLISGNAGGNAWGPVPGGGRQLNNPRWFAPWAGAGVNQFAGFLAGGADATGIISSAERLP